MRPLLLLPLLLCSALANAQLGRKEMRTDSGTIVLHFFRNGGVSTKEWTDKDQRWGRSWAYTKDGRVLIDHRTRRIAGHSSVEFSYHGNGAISRAEISEAPDAGIQWYRSTTTFDEAGERTGFTEQGRDNDGMIPRLDVRVAPAQPPPPQETVQEQRLFVNEVFVVNPTNSACRVVATPKYPSPALPGGRYTMAPGDTIRIGSYSMGETFVPWAGQLTLEMQEVELKARRKMVARFRTDEIQAGPEHRIYYVVIDGWTKAEKEVTAKPKKRWLFW